MKIEVQLDGRGSVLIEDAGLLAEELPELVSHAVTELLRGSGPKPQPIGFGAGGGGQLDLGPDDPDPTEAGWVVR